MVVFKEKEQLYSIEEYLKLERNSNRKHEFYNGKIKEVPGGTTNHNLIASKLHELQPLMMLTRISS